MQVHEVQSTSTDKLKQEVLIGDNTGHVLLTLLEDNVNTLEENNYCQLNRIQVHKYAGRVTLTYASFGSSFELIDEIATATESIHEEDSILSDAVVIAVNQLEEHFICLHSKKTSTTMNKSVATCSFCNTTQKLTKLK